MMARADPKPNHWHPVMLPDDYLRKMRQDLAEADAAADSALTFLHANPKIPDMMARRGTLE